ncbi:hypothetical protein PENARI_c009G02671 [Penicillium arizonense]|uniref:F-box domain-containing protein n=1 Tax=Penicillium arizonense TaxID=1835702 RepID=A0A1F5LHM0_PENAI|nr:hypothetical protein PENARI_c009G02671 [Penicillium arizonense]OGE52708.1 hypothetical protein PENARI_c009G02671 [Penicillium arizonense]
MTIGAPVVDPLTILPPEIVLQILEFAPVSALASLTATSKAWHQFIDITHQEAIYTSDSKTSQPPGGSRDFSFLSDTHSFAKVFENTTSWKDLCKRQTLLARNWANTRPVSQESVLQVGNDPVWRFKADFKRRFFVSTSHAGGLNVTDMDTGDILWRLPSVLDTDGDSVRPYAHLEYQDGMAVFDSEGDSVEVWQTDQEGAKRGEFRRIAILNHDCQTRGFQLSHWNLCVVSNKGQGFVYDMTQRPPKLTTHLKIEKDGVGHLDQSKDAVIYSMGKKGYFAYNKETGAFLGNLQPAHCTDRYHVRPPPATFPSAGAALAGAARLGPSHRFFPPGTPSKDGLVPIKIEKGPLPAPSDPEHVWHGEDEWGSGMICGNLFVGFSRAGRVFICSNWRKAVHDQASLAANSSILECESDGSSFDLGGWLSLRNHRVMFEIQDRIYVVALDDNDKIQDVEHPTRASYSLLTSSAPQLAVPISYMALADDAIMSTYTTLGWRDSTQPGGIPAAPGANPARVFPTKAIRIVSLAPDLVNKATPISHDGADPSASTEGTQSPSQNPPGQGTFGTQAGLLQLLSLLRDEVMEEADFEEFAEGELDDEWESVDEEEEGEEAGDESESAHGHDGA